MNSMKHLTSYLVIVGVLLFLLGLATYFLNFERHTLSLNPLNTQETILEYHAPGWDPFPHYVEISVNTEVPIIIRAEFSGQSSREETYTLRSGMRVVTIFPEDFLTLQLQNNQSTTGKVDTVLWCDSWNYMAATQIGTSIILLIVSAIKSRASEVKTKLVNVHLS